MLVELFSSFLGYFHVLIYLVTKSVLIRLFAFAFAPLAFWRLWAFTIRPALYPNAPKPLPYWIPGKLLFLLPITLLLIVSGADNY